MTKKWSCGKLGVPTCRIQCLRPSRRHAPTIQYWLKLCVGFNNCIITEQIYLFRSTARGESGPDSDYDLMVVVPDSTPVSLRDSGRAYKAIWRLGVATDVLVWTHSDFADRLPLKASLPSTIGREGKLLYAA